MDANASSPPDERHFRQVTRREKVVEHLFVGELLRLFWAQIADVEVLRTKVDAAGYDIVLTKNRMTRHVQIMASTGRRKDTCLVMTRSTVSGTHVASFARLVHPGMRYSFSGTFQL